MPIGEFFFGEGVCFFNGESDFFGDAIVLGDDNFLGDDINFVGDFFLGEGDFFAIELKRGEIITFFALIGARLLLVFRLVDFLAIGDCFFGDGVFLGVDNFFFATDDVDVIVGDGVFGFDRELGDFDATRRFAFNFKSSDDDDDDGEFLMTSFLGVFNSFMGVSAECVFGDPRLSGDRRGVFFDLCGDNVTAIGLLFGVVFIRVLEFTIRDEFFGLSSSVRRELFFRFVVFLKLTLLIVENDSSSVIRESSDFIGFLRVDFFETLFGRFSSVSLVDFVFAAP